MLVAWSAVALGQEPPNSPNITNPELDADLVHHTVDGRHGTWTDDAGAIVTDAPQLGVRLVTGYANAPLVLSWEGADGRERAPLLEHVWGFDVIGWLHYDRLRVGVDLPVYPVLSGELGRGGASIGDLSFDLRGTLLDGAEAPLGLGVSLRAAVPTATSDLPIGSQGVDWELMAILEKDFGDLTLLGNIGTRGVPEVRLYNVTWDDALVARLGASWRATEEQGASLEIAGSAVYAMFSPDVQGSPRGAGLPVEALVSGWTDVGSGVRLRGGVGTGLTQGIGAARFRGVASVSYTPDGQSDRDADGVKGPADICPKEAEDLDGFEDLDGCPD